MRIFKPIFKYICMMILSVITATFSYILIFNPTNISLGNFEVTSIFIFFAYVVFATPIQFFLHRNPQKFNLLHLIIYFVLAFIVCSILALYIDYGFVVFISFKVYLFSFLTALIFWTWDSLFLKK
ncbi:UPF0715 family protein [Bacillus safensis]|nr:UPF0715 family protein [Bacillus safensis]MBU8617564.1 UPF0715 family protein [Bacillus safensis]MBU8628692.1 UPF0715 family protein [Bacillus safensis]